MVWARRHVEVLDRLHVPFEPVESAVLPAGLEIQILSRDASDGAFTAVVRVPPGWRYDVSAWACAATYDAFVVTGSLDIGDTRFDRHDYTYRPAGCSCGPVSSVAGADVLVMTYGTVALAEPDPDTAKLSKAIEHRRLTDVPEREPLTDRVGTGMRSRTLRYDPDTGERIFVSSLARGRPRRREERIEWHPCVEEGFSLRTPWYFYRPPGIPHGPFMRPGTAASDTITVPFDDSNDGPSMVFRVDKKLVNNYVTVDEADRMWSQVPNLDPAVIVQSYRGSGVFRH